MRSIFIKLLPLALGLLSVCAWSQQKTNPATGIAWPVSCSSANMVYSLAANDCVATATGGTITGVTAGTGLSGGGASGPVTLSLVVPVAVANGGTGTSTPALVSGAGVNIGGSWPNQSVTNTLPMTYPAAGIPNSTGSAWGTSYNTTGTGTTVALSAGPTVNAPIFTGLAATNVEFDNATCTTAKTINANNGNKQKVTLTNAQTCALSFTQPSVGTGSIQLKVIQSAAGSFNGAISGCKWPGGIVPTVTQTTAAVDFISIYYDGTTTYCQIAQDFR